MNEPAEHVCLCNICNSYRALCNAFEKNVMYLYINYKAMKFTNVLLTILLVASVVTSTRSFAQTDAEKEQTQINKEQVNADADRNEMRQNDADSLNQAYKVKAKEAKSDAKEANRINDDAADAAKQAKKAARMEKKAQKARARAEKQVEKANKAARKSDNN